MSERRVVIQQTYRRYQKASRQQKSRILEEFAQLTGYTRAYAALVLRQWGTARWVVGPKGPLRLVARGAKRPRRPRVQVYDEPVRQALIHLWNLCDCMCGKRLVPAIGSLLPLYLRWGELEVSAEVQQKLLQLSPATADRLLREERKKLQSPRGRGHTRPAPSSLLSHIPLRTFDEWDREVLGQSQGNLVGHDGGLNRREFAFTCTLTELCVGWTELRPLRNKARVWVQQALDEIRAQLPIPLRALGTDTGSEFINHHLLHWCQSHGIAFSRARPYRKNDNCFAEERNNSLVRRTVGYLRYDTDQERALLSQIYQRQTLLTNYFYPCMKLVEKTRRGSFVRRRYDTPRSPYQRLMERPEVPQDVKRALTWTFTYLNPAQIKRELTELQQRLYEIASSKPLPDIPPRGRELVICPWLS